MALRTGECRVESRLDAARRLALLSLAAASAFASEPWPLPFFTADPKAVLAEAAKINPPGARDLALLDSDCAMKINEEGRALTTCRFLFRPLSQAGVEMIGTFQVPWAEWREQRPALRIRVIAPDGTAAELDQARITESGGAAKWVEAPLPSVAVNAVVEIETVAQDREMVVPGARFAYFEPDNLAIGHWRASVEAPAAMALRVKAELLPPVKRTESRIGPNQKVTVEFSDTGIRNPLPAAPPELSAPPRVAVAAGAGWDAIANWCSRAVDTQLGKAEGSMLGPEVQRVAVIRSVLDALQATHQFNGIPLGAASLVPQAPGEAPGFRTGDSLDLAMTLAARLRRVGIEADVALLTPFPGPDAEPDLPGIEAFTRALVYVPGRQPLWIDPCDPFAQASQLPAADQGRMALVARAGVNALVRTPIGGPAENRFTEYQNITLAKEGRGQIDEIEDGEGYFAAAFRTAGAALKAAPAADRGKYEQSLASAYGLDKIVQSDVVNLADLAKPMRLVFSGTGYRYAVTEGAAATVSLPQIAANGAEAGGLLNPLLAAYRQNPARTEDYYVASRVTVERRVHIAPPAGFHLVELPQLKPAPIGPLTYVRQAKQQADGAVDVAYRLEIPRNRFTAAEVKAMAEDIGRLEALPMVQVKFAGPSAETPKLGDLLAARDYVPAADLLARSGGAGAQVELLRQTRRQDDVRDSDDPLLAVAQEVIRGLLDENARRPWRIYYKGAAGVTLDSERAHLVTALQPYRDIGGVTLNLAALADVALSNLHLTYGNPEGGVIRVQFADWAHEGQIVTLGRFVKDGDTYKAVGMGDSAQ